MKNILVLTDFSDNASNALDYAAELSKLTGCSILIFHFFQVPVSLTYVPIALLSVEELQQSADTKMAELKTSFEKRNAGNLKIYAQPKLGDQVDELEEAAATLGGRAREVTAQHGRESRGEMFRKTVLQVAPLEG